MGMIKVSFGAIAGLWLAAVLQGCGGASGAGNDVQGAPAVEKTGVEAKALLAGDPVPGRQVYRFFNQRTGAHFYTASAAERDAVIASLPHYAYEGRAFEAYAREDAGLNPVFRFFNSRTGTHLYTIDEGEKAAIESLPEFSFEGVAFYASKTQRGDLRPVYRFFQTVKGFHFFTATESEKTGLVATPSPFRLEGIAFFVAPASLPTGAVTDSRLTGTWEHNEPMFHGRGSVSRYSFGSDGSFRHSTYVFNTLCVPGSSDSYANVLVYHEGVYGSVDALSVWGSNPARLYLLDSVSYVQYTRCDQTVFREEWSGSPLHFHQAGFDASGENSLVTVSDDGYVWSASDLDYARLYIKSP